MKRKTIKQPSLREIKELVSALKSAGVKVTTGDSMRKARP